MNKFLKFGCLGVIAVVVLLFIIGFLATPKDEIAEAYEKGKANAITEQTVTDTVAVVEEPKSRWVYSESEDKMGDSKKFAYVESDDLLQFQFPYDGGASSTLTIRKGPQGTDVYYKVSKGQILAANSFDGGTVRVKFDDEKPMKIGVTGPSDHSSDIIFLDSTSKLIQKMKSSKRMVIEVEFFNEGNRQIEFNVEGLEW